MQNAMAIFIRLGFRLFPASALVFRLLRRRADLLRAVQSRRTGAGAVSIRIVRSLEASGGLLSLNSGSIV